MLPLSIDTALQLSRDRRETLHRSTVDVRRRRARRSAGSRIVPTSPGHGPAAA